MSQELSPELREETDRLRRSWSRHPAEMLRDYMVAGIHDPLLNPQSIHARHPAGHAAFPGQFHGLKREELRFAVAMGWLNQVLRVGIDADELAAVTHALEHGADDAEGVAIPGWILDIHARLPVELDGVLVPDYLLNSLHEAGRTGPEQARQRALGTIARAWRSALDAAPIAGMTVLEAACGSANDYRGLDACGLTRHIQYRGFDLCEANIVNARALFPSARFEVGNVLQIDAPAMAFDCCIAHDLLEHLSPPACDQALGELVRVTRQRLFLGFFQMHEGPDHIVRPVDEYHWNTLSLPWIRHHISALGMETEAFHLETWLRWVTGASGTYYDTAYDLIASRPA